MTDETTTWLKKNSSINPLRRSLKTSLMFNPPSDMDASIMSNPDKGKKQQLFIPRMLQRANMRTQMLKAHDFKVPDLVTAKSSAKKNDCSPGSKTRRSISAVPARKSNARKSVLPVPKTKSQITSKQPERKSTIGSFPVHTPMGSATRRTANQRVIQKLIEIQQTKKNKESRVSGQYKPPADLSDISIPRSILKMKRNSLRRSSQISGKKPKSSKRVLFDGFGDSPCEEKENDVNYFSMEGQFQNDFDDFSTIEDPTVFLNFPNSKKLESSPIVKEPPKITTTDKPVDNNTSLCCNMDVNGIVKLWQAYHEKVNSLESMKNTLETSFMGLLEQVMECKTQFMIYQKDADDKYNELRKLGEELESKIKNKIPDAIKTKRSSSGRKSLENIEKLSEKSKVIRKSPRRS